MVASETRMYTAVRLAHINIVARNEEAFAAFYVNVMKCIVLRKPTTLSGEKVSLAVEILRGFHSRKAHGSGESGRPRGLRRCLAIYQEAQTATDILDRVHQFVRCIEGLILVSRASRAAQNCLSVPGIMTSWAISTSCAATSSICTRTSILRV